jgi:hypothetical protein
MPNGNTIVNGNIGIGTDNSRAKLDVYNNSMIIRSSLESENAILYFGTPFTTNSALKACIMAQGTSSFSRSKLHFCLDNTADNSTTYNAGTNNVRMTIDNTGGVGIYNQTPLSYLHLGNCTYPYSEAVLMFGKNNSVGGFRNAFMGYSTTFYLTLGDYGNSNNASGNTFVPQFGMNYASPADSLVIWSNGYVAMQFGFGQGSDERFKTNIQTIENALDKTLLLRGVNYNDFRIEPDQLKMGLIAQEVELIIPEVVHTNETTTMKSIEYQNLVGLLVEAIKELNNKISNLENILKKNNLS